MEAKLNIANILKDKPSGTKLYADAFGELSLERVKSKEIWISQNTFHGYLVIYTSLIKEPIAKS